MKILEFLKSRNPTGATFRKDEVIFRDGEHREPRVGLIITGSVNIYSDIASGAPPLHVWRPGQFFGFISLLWPEGEVDTLAAEDNTQVFFLKPADFADWIQNEPTSMGELLKQVMGALRSIPSSRLKAPEKEMDISSILTPEANKSFDDIRKETLLISRHLYILHDRIVAAGEDIFSSHTINDISVYLLLEGEVEEFYTQGEREIPAIIFRPGSIFGFLQGAGKHGHFLTARAKNGSARVVLVDANTLVRVGHLDSKLGYAIFLNIVLTIAIVQKAMIRA